MMRRSSPDVIRLLTHDHDNMRQMMVRLDEVDGDASLALLLRLRDELAVHSQLEDELIYPMYADLFDDDDSASFIEDSRQDHAFVDQLVDEIVSLPIDSLTFGHDAILLREAIERHTDQEEDVLFPRLQSACSQELLDDLGHRFMQRKQVLRRQRRRRRARETGDTMPALEQARQRIRALQDW